tara:strand:- start:3525 stop:3926 length:402 start_codon:yes stop_codon:yes gene_type:complete
MKVRVWNDNIHLFKQEIADKLYEVPAKQCIELEEDDANVLIKRYSPIILGGDDQPIPECYKMLRIDKDDLHRNRMHKQNKNKAGTYVCQACGYVAANKWELNGHSQDMHKDQWEDPEEAQESVNAEQPRKKRK